MDKIVQTIALCKRAGKLVIGFDAVKETIIKKQSYLLVLSEELSEKTTKEIEFMKQKYHVPLIIINAGLDKLWYILGKRAGIFSIIDQSLAEKLMIDASYTEAKQEEK